nr:magnesium transporter MRS2-11, chloroplastic-like [Ipomoea batatas]GMD36915.1 magnesium transporter MRS2-11, chloroplastic-like [Ipomoea batatas]GME10500.1 magnesium transporter MRS2-11, chloroplastic-like [Ipomoea batatas]
MHQPFTTTSFMALPVHVSRLRVLIRKSAEGTALQNYPSDLSHELLLCFRNPTMAAAVPTVNLLHLPAKSSELRLFVAGAYSILRLRTSGLWSPETRVVATKLPSIEAVRCVTKPENLSSDEEEEVRESQQDSLDAARPEVSNGSAVSKTFAGDSLSLGIREPVYQVVEVKSSGMVSTRKINRRHLLKSSGLRPRDIRSVDPSLWLTNSMPSLLVREHAILLNLGSLRAIVMQESVLIFNYNRYFLVPDV